MAIRAADVLHLAAKLVEDRHQQRFDDVIRYGLSVYVPYEREDMVGDGVGACALKCCEEEVGEGADHGGAVDARPRRTQEEVWKIEQPDLERVEDLLRLSGARPRPCVDRTVTELVDDQRHSLERADRERSSVRPNVLEGLGCGVFKPVPEPLAERLELAGSAKRFSEEP